MKLVYVISPKLKTADQEQIIQSYITQLKKDNTVVYCPSFEGKSVKEIMDEMVDMMRESIEAHIFWDSDCKICHFEFGMATALSKKIKLVSIFKKDELFERVFEVYKEEYV